MHIGTLWGGWLLWNHRQEVKPHSGWLGKKFTWTEWGLAVVVLFSLLQVFVQVNVPELFYDALVYHLAVPSHWIREHHIFHVPYTIHSHFPMAVEMLYTGALLVTDERLARILHATLGVLGGLAVFSLGRRISGRKVGFWAAGLFLATPVVAMNMEVAGADVGAVFFAVLGVNALLEWYQAEKTSTRQVVLTGLLMGMAFACKYTTAFMLGPFTIGLVLLKYRNAILWKPVLLTGIQLFVVGFLIILPFWARNYIYTGNPVYPFAFTKIHSPLIDEIKMEQEMYEFREYSDRTWIQYLRQPWDLSFYMATSNSFIGATYLFLAPWVLILLGARRYRGPPLFICLVAVSTVTILIWTTQTQITRYLIPCLPLLAILGAMALKQSEQWNRGLVTLGKWTLVFLAFWVLTAKFDIILSHRDPVGFFFGLESKQTYLDRKLMNTYTPMARIINQLPKTSKILLLGEARTYYIERAVLSSTVHDRTPFIQWLDEAESAEAVWSRLRGLGFTHLFIHYQEAARVRGWETYIWEAEAIHRFQEFITHYTVARAKIGQMVLYTISEKPDRSKIIKPGRPLFTYDRATVGKVTQHYGVLQRAQRRNKREDVRAHLIRMAALAPDWQYSYLGLANWYLDQKKYEEALQYYQKAEQLADLAPWAYNNLGAVHMQFGNQKEAKRCFTRALEKDTKQEKARQNLERLEGMFFGDQ